MSQAQPKKDLFHVALSKQIAEQIMRGTASFLTAHENERIDLPYNPVTGKNYTAANNMVLSAKGYADSRWLTYDQAVEQGYQVKKGEKATEIAYYHYVDYNTKEKLDKPKIQTVKLFNAQQLTGIETMPSRTSSKEEALAKVQSIFENSQVKIVNNQKDKVFYRSKDDTIYMPPKENYKDELAYSSAAIHELCRWAGNGEDRLNYETVPFGTEAFARQKLRAEIATYMLCKEMGIPFEPQGQQFADQWAQIIEKHPFEILNAAKDAEKIKGFVMEFDKTLEKAQELEQGQEVQKEKTFEDYGITFYNNNNGNQNALLKNTDKLKQEILNRFSQTVDPSVADYFMENMKIYRMDNKNFEFSYKINASDPNSEKFEKLSDPAKDQLDLLDQNLHFIMENLSSDFREMADKILVPSKQNFNKAEQAPAEQVRQTEQTQAPEQQEKQQAPKKEWKEMIKLSVPYDEKDEAKKLGAKWSAKQETWYVLDGADLQPFYNWLPKEKKVELIMASRDYLNVPREEKDEAKALGAKWDRFQKSWYVEKGTDLEPFAKWTGQKEQAVSQPAEQPKQEQSAEQKQEHTEKQEVTAAPKLAEDKTFLAVPFEEKNAAKKLGAKWDKDNKSWYVEKGADLNQFKDWLVDENTVVPAKQEAVSPEIEFAEHCRANGLDVDAPIMDGQIHRVPLIGKPQGKDGAYCAFLDGVPAGWSENFVTGEKSKFVSSGMQLTEEEKAKQRAEHAQKLQEREAKRQRDYDIAANNAKKVLSNSFEADKNHAYLQQKGIKPYIAMQNNFKQLVVPVRNIHDEIRGVQFIDEDGSKKFLSGVEKKGNFALLAEEAKDVSKVLVCEGFATGASLHEATKLPVAVAFDAGNIESVSKALAEKYKGIEITICADNDQYRDNNVGLEKAKNAALAVDAKLAVPQFTKEEQAQKLTDFNDLHKAEGLEAVSRQVSQAKKLTQNIAQNKQQSKKKTAQLAR